MKKWLNLTTKAREEEDKDKEEKEEEEKKQEEEDKERLDFQVTLFKQHSKKPLNTYSKRAKLISQM